MASGNLLFDELVIPEAPARSSHPMDSSRILLALMMLSHHAKSVAGESQTLDGVITKSVLKNLLFALHFRDASTVRHSRRVAQLSVGMAHYLGWEERQQRVLEIASLLHDIGKIGVPDNILFKPGKLSPDEARLMALHYRVGMDILQACRVDEEVLEIVSQSQNHADEVIDGYRTVGSDIHQGARILAVADAYDSLASEQVYRDAKPHPEIMKILSAAAGTQFDGNIVCALARWVETEGPPFVNAPQAIDDAPQVEGSANSDATTAASSLCHIFSYLYLLESLYDGFCLIDSDMQFVIWNPGLSRLLGHPTNTMLHRVWTSRGVGYCDQYGETLPEQECSVRRAVDLGKPTTSKVWMSRIDGNTIEVELQTVPLLNQHGKLQGVAEIYRDLTRLEHKPEEIRELKLAARRDPLTGVANRTEMEAHLATVLEESSDEPNPKPMAVMFADIDHFKQINDTYGHAIGDKVLVEISRLLQQETYSGELVSRYGGEEFVIVCPDTDLEHAVQRAERLRLQISGCIVDGTTDLQVTASFGVTVMEPGDSNDSLLRRADTALYLAKDAGRNRSCSLTSEDVLALDSNPKHPNCAEADGMVLASTFQAFIAADTVVYKLGGFVHDEGGKLVEVTTKQAVIRMGDRGLLPLWGSSDAKQPVQIEVTFGDEPVPIERKGKGTSRSVQVNVRIRPIGWVRDPQVFDRRAKRVLKTLRSFFAAN